MGLSNLDCYIAPCCTELSTVKSVLSSSHSSSFLQQGLIRSLWPLCHDETLQKHSTANQGLLVLTCELLPERKVTFLQLKQCGPVPGQAGALCQFLVCHPSSQFIVVEGKRFCKLIKKHDCFKAPVWILENNTTLTWTVTD